MLNSRSTFAALALLSLCSVPAAAGVIFTTGADAGGTNPAFDTNHKATATVSVALGAGKYFSFADPFSLAADAKATDLLVPLAWFSNTFKGSELDFYILADANGLPDTDAYGNPVSPLYSGTATGIASTTPTIFDVALTGSATLTAGTTYWLEARLPGTAPCTSGCTNQSVSWFQNFSSTKPAGYDSLLGNTGWGGVGNPTMAFVLEDNSTTSSTPEPSTLFLVPAALAALFFTARRKRPATQRP